MKKTLVLFLLMLTASFGFAAQDYYYTLLFGKAGDLLLPAKIVASSIAVDKDCVSASATENPSVIHLEGRKLGSAVVTCRLASGTNVSIHVRVVSSFQALVKDVKDTNNGVEWDGVYQFIRPSGDYSFSYTVYDHSESWDYAVQYVNPRYYFWDGQYGINHLYDGERELYLITNTSANDSTWYTTDGDRLGDRYTNLETSHTEYIENRDANIAIRGGFEYLQLLEETFENTFMKVFRQYGKSNKDLAKHFVGYDYCCGVRCWVFEGRGLNTINYTFWVDPANGMCLRCIYNEDELFEVTKYDMKD